MKSKKFIFFILIIILPCILIVSIGSLRTSKDTSTENTESQTETDTTASEIEDSEDTSNNTTSKPIRISTITGVITEINLDQSSVLINNASPLSSFCPMISINADTKIFIGNVRSGINDLSVGDHISVEYAEKTEDSDPAEITNTLRIMVTVFKEIGVITNINLEDPSFMIGKKPDTEYQLQTLILPDADTRIFIDGKIASLDQLSIGDYLSIEYTGSQKDSFSSRLQAPLRVTKIEPSFITGVIKESNPENACFLFCKLNDPNFLIEVSIDEYTVLLKNNTTVSFNTFSVGDHVAITYTGGILESYPASLHQVLIIESINP